MIYNINTNSYENPRKQLKKKHSPSLKTLLPGVFEISRN